MPDIDTTVILDALSAVTGAKVRHLKGCKGWHTTLDELTTDNFLSNVFGKEHMLPRPSATAGPTSSRLPSFLKKLFRSSRTEASTLRRELFVDLENFLDPRFDYDFRRGSDSSQCSRGGELYTRPWGWYRFALKVKNKYPDGNTWLGSDGWRSHSSPGEWPVSFHGTSIEGAKGITRSHYRAGPGKTYGRGIYSTPDIETADTYAMFKKFTSSKTGKTYRVIMQNRINPKKREFTDEEDYWLIPVPEGTSAEEEKRIVEASIRPYGILIKKV